MVWIVLLIGAGTVGSSAFSLLSSSFGAGPGTESGCVTERLDDLAGTGGEIAIIADGIDIDKPAVAASLAAGLSTRCRPRRSDRRGHRAHCRA